MQTPYVPPSRAAEEPEQPRLRRPVEGRVVGGVCAGLADHLAQQVWHVRLAFVGATFLGWRRHRGLPVPVGTHAADAGRAGAASGGERGEGATVPVPGGRRVSRETLRQLGIGAGLVVLGVALFAQQSGLNLRLGVLLPLLAVAIGAVLAWSQLDGAERGRWLGARGGAAPLRARPARARRGRWPPWASSSSPPRAGGWRSVGRGRRRGRGPRRRRADRRAVGAPAVARPAATSRPSGSGRPSAPTSPRTCTTRSCRRSP